MARKKITGQNALTLFNSSCDMLMAHNAKVSKESFQGLGPGEGTPDGPIDVVPKEGDFSFFPFRHISETIVGSGTWKSSDFTAPGVLKASTPMLAGVTAYRDHILETGNNIGIVGNTVYTAAYTNDAGTRIPAGIDAPFIIDNVLHPRLVREMNSPHGSPVDSASVTVIFEWESSHEFEEPIDFFMHVGEMLDGREVTRVATSIEEYLESSLVWDGADPFAKMLDSSGQVPISRMFSLNKGELFFNNFNDDPLRNLYETNNKYFVYDCLDSEKIVHLNKPVAGPTKKTIQKPNKKMNEDLQNFLIAFFACKPEELESKLETQDFDTLVLMSKDDQVEMQNFKTDAAKFATEKDLHEQLKTSYKNLQKEKSDLESEIAQNKKNSEAGEKILEAAREKATSLYNQFSKGEPDDTILNEIKDGDIESVEAKIVMFGGQLYEEFGAVCEVCNSTKIKMRSSADPKDDVTKEKSKGAVNLVDLNRK